MENKNVSPKYGDSINKDEQFIHYPRLLRDLLRDLSDAEFESFIVYLNNLWESGGQNSDFGKFFLEYFIDFNGRNDDYIILRLSNSVGAMLETTLSLENLKGDSRELFVSLKENFPAYYKDVNAGEISKYLDQVKQLGSKNIFLISYILEFGAIENEYENIEEFIMNGFSEFSSQPRYLNASFETAMEAVEVFFFADYILFTLSSRSKLDKEIKGIKNINSSISIQDYQFVVATRLLGMGLDAQQKSSEWKPHELEDGIFPLAHADGDQRGTYKAVFFLGGNLAETQAIDLDPSTSPYNKNTAEKILQRWGIVHARLYVGITVALTKTLGDVAEIDENDLFKIAGLNSDISNGNLAKDKARVEVKEVLDDLKSLCVYVISSDEKYSTGNFPIYIVEPLIIYDKVKDVPVSIRARVAPGLWARDIFKFDQSPVLPFSAKILDIPARRNPLAATFSLWLSLNMYRFTGKNKMSVGKILRAILPDVNPHKSWNGLDITWTILHPRGAQQWETKNARLKIRQQFTRMPELLLKRGIKMDLIDYKSTSDWEEFMETEVCIEFLNLKRINRPRKASKDQLNSNNETTQIRYLMNKTGITQAEMARKLGVSQPTVSNWLRTGKIPEAMKSKINDILAEGA